MQPTLKIVKPQTAAEKKTGSVTDTIDVTPQEIRSWKKPPFQRDLSVNFKVMTLAQKIADDGGVIPGTIVIGILANDPHKYVVDGQHRLEAFLLSECPIGYVDARMFHAKTMVELAREFRNVNQRLVNMKPDDFLRSDESSNPSLEKIRKKCPFVGYGHVRRNENTPIVSMSALLRCWASAGKEVPQSGAGGSTMDIADALTPEDIDPLIRFLTITFGAWGKDPTNYRLWGNLNLTVCMWLYRRVVVHGPSAITRSARLDDDDFGKCLMAVSADAHYAEWLIGRQLTERDRSPGYNRVKGIFAKRLAMETGKTVKLPSPAWAAGRSK
jgi:hypothetical protein